MVRARGSTEQVTPWRTRALCAVLALLRDVPMLLCQLQYLAKEGGLDTATAAGGAALAATSPAGLAATRPCEASLCVCLLLHQSPNKCLGRVPWFRPRSLTLLSLLSVRPPPSRIVP